MIERLRRHRLDHPVDLIGGLVAIEVLALLGYLSVASVSITAPRYVLYPLVWITVAVAAVAWIRPPPTDGRRRLLAGIAAGGYVLVLAWLAGIVGGGVGHVHGGPTVDIVWLLPPGWGPALVYRGAIVQLSIFPYQVVGYLALGYLVFAALLTGRALLGGVVGVASCASCTLPLAAAFLSGTVGGVGMASAASVSYDLSTAAFLLAIGLLASQLHDPDEEH